MKQIYDQLPAGARAPDAIEEDLPVLEPHEIPSFNEVTPLADVPVADMTQAELLMASALNTSTPTLFGQTLSSRKRRTKRPKQNAPQQGLLFSWN